MYYEEDTLLRRAWEIEQERIKARIDYYNRILAEIQAERLEEVSKKAPAGVTPFYFTPETAGFLIDMGSILIQYDEMFGLLKGFDIDTEILKKRNDKYLAGILRLLAVYEDPKKKIPFKLPELKEYEPPKREEVEDLGYPTS